MTWNTYIFTSHKWQSAIRDAFYHRTSHDFAFLTRKQQPRCFLIHFIFHLCFWWLMMNYVCFVLQRKNNIVFSTIMFSLWNKSVRIVVSTQKKQKMKWNSKTLAVDGELLPPPSGSLPLKSRPSPNSFSLLTVKDKKKAAFREHQLKHRRTLAKEGAQGHFPTGPLSSYSVVLIVLSIVFFSLFLFAYINESRSGRKIWLY